MRYLIVKTSSQGDIIQSFPVASYLKEKFPDCHIDWVVEEPFKELLESHPLISRTLVIKTKKWRRGKSLSDLFVFRKELKSQVYDAVFDLQGNVKSGLITFLAQSAHKIGFSQPAEKPNLLFTYHTFDPPSGQDIRDDYLYLIKSYFSDKTPFNPKPVVLNAHTRLSYKILVFPGSAWKNKRLSEEQLIHFLKKYPPGDLAFGWGTPEENQCCQALKKAFPGSHVLARVSLPELQHIMSRASLVISMDSLPLHLAATTSVPTLSFFGPSSALKYGPKGLQHELIQGVCPYGRTFEKRCPILRSCPTGACLKTLR